MKDAGALVWYPLKTHLTREISLQVLEVLENDFRRNAE